MHRLGLLRLALRCAQFNQAGVNNCCNMHCQTVMTLRPDACIERSY